MEQRCDALVFLASLLLAATGVVLTENADQCAVYDPFKVLPDSSRYQMGGAFPLHDTDCKRLKPSVVHEVVAIQWALTHWNQNQAHHNAKLGLHAGDSCSRAREAGAQTLRFLDAAGWHEPTECLSESDAARLPRLLGVLVPRDTEGAVAVSAKLADSGLPLVAYSTESANVLVGKKVPTALATAPTLGVYADMVARLVSSLHSDLVVIVEDGADESSDSSLASRLEEHLKSRGIHTAEVVPTWHPSLVEQLRSSDASIIVSLAPSSTLVDVLSTVDLKSALADRLWIAVPTDDGPTVSIQHELTSKLSAANELRLVLLGPVEQPLPAFRDYFSRVLRNNYRSYSLLTAYTQQVLNCTDVEACEVLAAMTEGDANASASSENDDERLGALLGVDAPPTLAAIRATYGFALAALKISTSKSLSAKCERPSAECGAAVLAALTDAGSQWTWGAADPTELAGKRLAFRESPLEAPLLLADGIRLQALLLSRQRVVRLMEYETGASRTATNNQNPVWPIDDQRQTPRSLCMPYRPFCDQCDRKSSLGSEKAWLSVPRHYALYIAGLFDLHTGAECNSYETTDITLPMAFVHTVWTFRQRFPQLGLLTGLDLGALVQDVCGSARRALEAVVQAESSCQQLQQAGRNITLVPGSTIGYVAGVAWPDALASYFDASAATSSSNSPALVTVQSSATSNGIGANGGGGGGGGAAFSAMPTAKHQTQALLRVLRKLGWQLVTAVLSETDADSLSLFHEFERSAPDHGVCLAEVRGLAGSVVSAAPKRSANVTILFTTRQHAAAYLAGLRAAEDDLSEQAWVLMGDAHDWKTVSDATTAARLAGRLLAVQPRDVVHADFRAWLASTTPLSLPEPWFWAWTEAKHGCALSQASKSKYGKMCTGDELLQTSKLGRLTRAGYVARGVERLLFAVDSVHRRLCPRSGSSSGGSPSSSSKSVDDAVCAEFWRDGRRLVAALLQKTRTDDDVELLWMDAQKADWRTVGNWTSATGLRLEAGMLLKEDVAKVRSQCAPPLCKCFLDRDFFERPLHHAFLAEDGAGGGAELEEQQKSHVFYRAMGIGGSGSGGSGEHSMRGWAWRLAGPIGWILVGLATLLAAAALAVFGLVVVKMARGVLRGNQSLGLCLLAGIVLMCTAAIALVADPSDEVCRSRPILHGVGHALAFGVLITKALHLRNAETLGFATKAHISYWNYMLLLFFITAVQLALSLRWVAEPLAVAWTSGEDVDGQGGGKLTVDCVLAGGSSELVLAHSYPLLLLLLGLFVNSRNRNIKRNYKETSWLMAASLSCTAVAILWMGGMFFVPSVSRHLLLSSATLLSALLLLALLFGPKLYILLCHAPVTPAIGRRDSLADEDDTDPRRQRSVALFEAPDEPSTCASITRSTECASGSPSSPTPSSAVHSPRSIHNAPVVSPSTSAGGSNTATPQFAAVIRKKKLSIGSGSGVVRSQSEDTVPDAVLPIVVDVSTASLDRRTSLKR